jgi:hypothetical protein
VVKPSCNSPRGHEGPTNSSSTRTSRLYGMFLLHNIRGHLESHDFVIQIANEADNVGFLLGDKSQGLCGLFRFKCALYRIWCRLFKVVMNIFAMSFFDNATVVLVPANSQRKKTWALRISIACHSLLPNTALTSGAVMPQECRAGSSTSCEMGLVLDGVGDRANR